MSENNNSEDWFVDPLDHALDHYVVKTVAQLRDRGFCPARCIEIITEKPSTTEIYPLTFDTAEKIIFLRLKKRIQQGIINKECPF